MSEHPVVHKLQLKILISDRTRHGSPLWSEHGLSVVAHCTYSEDREPVTILFDTGASASLLRHNLETEGPPTTDIDTVFLSHCHRDHTGGLSALLDDTDATFNLIAHPDITRRAFNLREGMKEVGPEPEVWEKIPRGRLLLVREPVQIHPGVWVSGSIPRETEFERPRPNMYTLSDGRLIPDTDPDDMALWFRLRDEGLVVLTGCGHSGIVNTIRHAARRRWRVSPHRGKTGQDQQYNRRTGKIRCAGTDNRPLHRTNGGGLLRPLFRRESQCLLHWGPLPVLMERLNVSTQVNAGE